MECGQLLLFIACRQLRKKSSAMGDTLNQTNNSADNNLGHFFKATDFDGSSDLWQTIPDSPVTTGSNHTPIHNGLLFDGVRFWPGQQ